VTREAISQLTITAYADHTIDVQGDLRLSAAASEPLLAFFLMRWITREDYLASTKEHIGKRRIGRQP
jgi:hypothetical protein